MVVATSMTACSSLGEGTKPEPQDGGMDGDVEEKAGTGGSGEEADTGGSGEEADTGGSGEEADTGGSGGEPDDGGEEGEPDDEDEEGKRDAGDGTAPVGAEIVYSRRLNSNDMVLESDALRDVDIDPLTVESDGSEYFFILSVPETWTTLDMLGAQYCLVVDNTVLACAHFQSAHAAQRIPVTVIGAKNLAAGTHTIKAQWGCFDCASRGGQLRIGTHYASWLVAMRAEGAQYAVRETGGDVYSLVDRMWANIDLSPTTLTIDSTGCDYLFALNVPETWTSAATASAEFRIMLDDEPLASGIYSSAVANQRVPVTVVAAANLPAGEHTVRAQFLGPGDGGFGITGGEVTIGSTVSSWLIAVPVPSGIVHATRPKESLALAGGTMDMDIDPLSLKSSGGNHLFILNATNNWVSTSSSWVNFLISLDGELLSGGVHSGEQDQRVPTTVVGVKNLEAGSHSFKAQWDTATTGMTANQGGWYPTRLIGL